MINIQMSIHGHDATPYHNTKIVSPCGEWEVGFHEVYAINGRSTHTGWFEWVGGDNLDDEITGGLIFEIHANRPYLLELVDYDGVFSLPQPVAGLLIQAGVFVSSCFIDGDEE